MNTLPLLKIWNFDEEYYNVLRSESFRRYGTTYGSASKLLYELIDFGIEQSKQKPSFASLQKHSSSQTNAKKKKIGKIEMKYQKIIDHLIDNDICPYEHSNVLDGLIQSTWKASHTWKTKRKELLIKYDKRIYEESLKEVK